MVRSTPMSTSRGRSFVRSSDLCSCADGKKRQEKKCPHEAGKQSPQVSAWTKDRADSLGRDRGLGDTRKEVGRFAIGVVWNTAFAAGPGNFG